MARDDKRKQSRGNHQERTDLSSRPFQQLRGMKVGPLCLSCGKPISRVQDQRQGFLHDACESKASYPYVNAGALYAVDPGDGSDDLVLVRVVQEQPLASVDGV